MLYSTCQCHIPIGSVSAQFQSTILGLFKWMPVQWFLETTLGITTELPTCVSNITDMINRHQVLLISFIYRLIIISHARVCRCCNTQTAWDLHIPRKLCRPSTRNSRSKEAIAELLAPVPNPACTSVPFQQRLQGCLKLPRVSRGEWHPVNQHHLNLSLMCTHTQTHRGLVTDVRLSFMMRIIHRFDTHLQKPMSTTVCLPVITFEKKRTVNGNSCSNDTYSAC